MLAVRIDNLTPGGTRRMRLYEALGKLEIRPNKVKEERRMFFVIIEERYIEKLLDKKSKEIMKKEGFEVLNPLEYNAMKTVVAKQIDEIVDYYNEQDIITSIEESNTWAKVENIVKLPTATKMLKIRFETTEMALHAIRNGMYILNQSIPPRNIEKEIFIKLKACLNCLS